MQAAAESTATPSKTVVFLTDVAGQSLLALRLQQAGVDPVVLSGPPPKHDLQGKRRPMPPQERTQACATAWQAFQHSTTKLTSNAAQSTMPISLA